jgi:hypothetical protein
MTTELSNLLYAIYTQSVGLEKLALEYGVESPEIKECTDRQISTLSVLEHLAMLTQAEAETYA